jgi:hypothetical protein
VFTDPSASDQLNLPSHSGQHTDLNNAVEALEAKVGADSSAVTSSHDYKIAQLEARNTAGLVLISRTTVGSAVSSVTVSGVFSSTYDNYRVIVENVVTSTNTDFSARLGAVTTGYKYARSRTTMAGTTATAGSTSHGFLRIGGVANSAGYASAIAFDLYAPNLARATRSTSAAAYGHPTVGGIDVVAAWEPSSTQHTDLTILPESGTMTGGTIDVYGYAKA